MFRSLSAFLLSIICLVVAGCGGGGGGGGAIPAFTISGSVTISGAALPGTTVTLSGPKTVSTTTDANGKYTFSSLPAGRYIVTPGKSGMLCNPTFRQESVKGADLTNVDFTAKTSSTTLLVEDELGNLGTVDVATGIVQVIGNMSVVMTDIALDPSGTLYGVSQDSLYRIDKDTAAVTLVGKLNLSDATSLEFDTSGVLYTATGSLFTVNTTTGTTTRIGNGSFPYYSSGDMAFMGNKLYLSSKNGDIDTDLVILDTATGRGTLVGKIGFPDVFGLSSNDCVNLYGVSGTSLISINVSTGAGTVIKDLSGQGLGKLNGVVFSR